MKIAFLIAPLSLTACVSVSVPNLVSDSVKVTKDAYKSVMEKNSDAKNKAAKVFTHSYLAKDKQTILEIKQSCIQEAAQKLKDMSGRDFAFTVSENEITTINDMTVANCKLLVEG
jgi:hypothetical protein